MGLQFTLQSKCAVVCVLSLTFALVLFLSGVASAHRPLFSDPSATGPDSALRIPDPSVSHVIYSELTKEAPIRWFVFENEKPQEVAFQLGVPRGPHAEVVDPVWVLFGPELSEPPDWLPVVPPQGDNVGAVLIPRADKPHLFDEPVTGTESWILVDTRIDLPSPGTYYGVIYDRNGHEGKVWVSVGQKEGFSWRDVPRLSGWIRDVRRFHEVPGWPRWMWIGVSGVLIVAATALVWLIRLRR